MNLDEIPRGQLSTIILMTLLETDKYGYEIIDEVLKKTNGKISIKQPSLYSSLKRMEDQKIISSYWRDSDIGGRRHYYHLTDLGKKHLEKWKNDLPENFNQNIQNDNSTKVLQQENIFNLDKPNEINETASPEPKKDDAFIQFDLFSNSTIVTPPINNLDKTNSTSENIDILSTPKITNQPVEQHIQNFEYVKKVNKSFSDSLNDNIYYNKKYVDDNSANNTKINDTNSVIIEENSSFNIVDDKPNKISINNLENYPADNQIKQNELTENIAEDITDKSNLSAPLIEQPCELTQSETTELKDDGVFITERLNPEDMPKPTKWDTHRFEVYVSGNNIAPDLKRPKGNYEDRVKDLYEQSKANAENQELELIDNKIKFATYKNLKEFYEEQNIKFKPYVKSLKNTSKDYNMIKITKLNMLSALFLFAFVSIISLCFGIACSSLKNVKLNNPISFIIFPLLACLYFGYYLVLYLKAPQKKVALDLSKFKIKIKYLAIALLLIPIIFAINIIIGFSFANFSTYIITALYPTCLTFSYMFFCVSRKLILKTKFIY